MSDNEAAGRPRPPLGYVDPEEPIFVDPPPDPPIHKAEQIAAPTPMEEAVPEPEPSPPPPSTSPLPSPAAFASGPEQPPDGSEASVEQPINTATGGAGNEEEGGAPGQGNEGDARPRAASSAPPAAPAQGPQPARPGSTLTLEVLAADKKLPEEFLADLGLGNLRRKGVVIRYRLLDGSVAPRRNLRTKLSARDGSRWLGGKAYKPIAYGLWRLEEAREAGYLLVVPGESDCWTLWYHHFPALGLPGRGASMTKKIEEEYLDEIPRVVIIKERDEKAEAFVHGVAARLKKLGWEGEASVLEMPEGVKDPNELYQNTGSAFKETLEDLLAKASLLDTAKTEPLEILDRAPARITRPLCLVGAHAYAASWIWVRDPASNEDRQAFVILRGDGLLFSDEELEDARALDRLGITVSPLETPPDSRLWSGRGVQRYLEGQRPSPATVFQKVLDVIDRFIDFSRSLADQRTMCELVACYVCVSYLLDAFNVVGYLWPNGNTGSGKSQLLFAVTELAYLGTALVPGGSYASLRDLADYGACLGFDDAEAVMNPKKSDPEKRALLLAGNRRGVTVTLKEPDGPRGWKTRHVHAYCPRLFSAINQPDAVLGSRSITIPLVRSTDRFRADADPLDHALWPHDRLALIDDLWAMGLEHLPRLREYSKRVGDQATLHGRLLEPWRAILAVAQWLEQDHGQDGLFDRMNQMSAQYQDERGDFEVTDSTRVLILALHDMFAESATASLTFATERLAADMQRVAEREELIELGQSLISPEKTGMLLKSLRFTKAQRTASNKRWTATADDLQRLAESYGVDLKGAGTPGTPGNPASDDVPGCQECQGCQVDPEPPQPAPPPSPPPPRTPDVAQIPSSDGGRHEES